MSHTNGHDHPPPQSPEAEAAVLGCIMLAPDPCLTESITLLPLGASEFFDDRHKTIYAAMIDARRSQVPIDIITLTDRMRTAGSLDRAGGYAYLSSLPDSSPSAAALSHYTSIVHEKFQLRRLLTTCREISTRVIDLGDQADVSDLWFYAQSELAEAFDRQSQSKAGQSYTVQQLMDYQINADPNCVLGFKPDGSTTRYLCRSHSAWIIGPSGIGKSSWIRQLAISWSLGHNVFGMRPRGPLRVLIVQGENDIGDEAEALQGVMGAMGIGEFETPAHFDTVHRNLKILTERRTVGRAFTNWLAPEIKAHQADVVFVDPLMSFGGIDVTRQDQCSRLLREWLNPVLEDTGAVLIGAHHTGKTGRGDNGRGKGAPAMTVTDYMYSGLGSSELVNWARAVQVLVPDGNDYKLMLAKRGQKAWATNTDGVLTNTLWLRHGKDKIAWEQIDAPEADPTPERKQDGKAKVAPPTKAQRIAFSNCHELLASVPEDGESARALGERIKRFAAARLKIVVSLDTCRESVIQALLENGKLTADPDSGLFRKGPNA